MATAAHTTSALEFSPGATAAVDDLTVDLQAWIGQLRDLQLKAARTVRLAQGTTAEAQARAMLASLNAVNFPRSLLVARTEQQLAEHRASSRVSMDFVARQMEVA